MATGCKKKSDFMWAYEKMTLLLTWFNSSELHWRPDCPDETFTEISLRSLRFFPTSPQVQTSYHVFMKLSGLRWLKQWNFLGFHQNQVVFIIPLTVSFQIDPDKTKCGGAKYPDDNVSDNVSFVSISS